MDYWTSLWIARIIWLVIAIGGALGGAAVFFLASPGGRAWLQARSREAVSGVREAYLAALDEYKAATAAANGGAADDLTKQLAASKTACAENVLTVRQELDAAVRAGRLALEDCTRDGERALEEAARPLEGCRTAVMNAEKTCRAPTPAPTGEQP